ncbi:MAG: hypothetical protein JXB13_10320 [Phycisphaerae bacterium]|nr:hypothetical protein [Phycisphaerae bacterium]
MTPDLPDEQLVRAFAHEFYHASRHARSAFGGNGHATLRFLRFFVFAFLRFRAVDEEAAADEFADALLHTLGPEGIARWATALRDMVRLPQENESTVES